VALAVTSATIGAVVAVGVLSTPTGGPERDAYGLNEIARNGTVQGELYPGDPASEAALVQTEDERIVYVRKVASAAYWNLAVDAPYRFQTGAAYTLVLPARETDYTLGDLLVLAPETLIQNPDGSYLLRENVAVMQGATLALSSESALDLRLESSPAGFTSIVAFGGRIDVAGTADAPVSIRSWNSALGGPDLDTADGRAYLRVIGGEAALAFADVSNLGFWSGNTGGVAVTGNDGLDDVALEQSVAAADEPIPAPGGAPVVDPSGLFAAAPPAAPLAGETEDPEDSEDDAPAPAAAPAPAVPPGDPGSVGLATAAISDSTFTGNAFGLFASNAQNVTIARSTVSGSLVDGITFHRLVTSSVVTDSRSTGNAVDGVSLGRSSSGVTLTGVTASRNGRNGISIDGQSLADGPSASGTAVEGFGGNTVIGSTVARNGRYGVEISGGTGVRVRHTTVVGNPAGVVVDRGADDVHLSQNEFSGQREQSVAIRDTVTDATVQDNTIVGGDTGVYVRNATATVESNEVSAVTNHGVTLVGDVSGSQVQQNEIAGDGRTAVRASDALGAVVGENDLDGWRPAPTVQSVVGYVLQPLTVIWLLLALLLVATALTRKDRQYGRIRDPYEERVPLTSLSKGVVTIDSLKRAEP
jgi:hypothetical protein